MILNVIHILNIKKQLEQTTTLRLEHTNIFYISTMLRKLKSDLWYEYLDEEGIG